MTPAFPTRRSSDLQPLGAGPLTPRRAWVTIASGGAIAILIPAPPSGLGCSSDLHGCPCGYRSEEHTSELQSLMRISYADFCLKKKQPHHYYRLLLEKKHISSSPIHTHKSTK